MGGTIGLDVFIGKLGVLDFPARRFCLLEPTDPAAVSLEAAHWQAATLRNGTLFLPVSLGEHTKVDAFFDTGSSVFPMFVDTALWKELTGIDDPTTATTTTRRPRLSRGGRNSSFASTIGPRSALDPLG